MTHIHDAFELAFAILSVFPCFLIIIVYSFLRKELKPSNYFKLQLIISMLINIILNFVKNYTFEHDEKKIEQDEHYQCNNTNYKYIAISKSYFEMVNLLFLTSFMILLNYIMIEDDKKKRKNNIMFIILSLINWVLPIYIIFIYISLNDTTAHSLVNIDKYDNIFYFITGQCVYFSKIKREIHLYLIPCIFLVDVINYIILCRKLISKKKEDRDNAITYKLNLRRITINFISHLIFFGVQYADIFFLDCFFKNENCSFFLYYEYYNIVNNASFSIISYTCIFERRIISFLKEKFACCLSEEFEEDEEEDDEDSDEYDDEDEEPDVIYDDRTTIPTNNE